jgi:hypothetical protein
MNINDKQDLTDTMAFLRAENSSDINLTTASVRKNSTGDTLVYADTWWDELVQWGKDNPDQWIGDAKGEVPNASELIGYHVTIDGIKATLVILSYSQGGFEGCILVDGHITTMDDLIDAWFDETNIEDYKEGWECGNSHAILDYVDIPQDWEVLNG